VIPDTRALDPLSRFRAAEAVRTAHDVQRWPRLGFWNDQPCARHEAPDPLCRFCGVILRRHQRTGALWLYLAGQGLLADSVGLGKTAQVAAVLAFCMESAEIPDAGRAVIICRSSATGQWKDELARMIPSLRVVTADGTPAQRRAVYATTWDCALITPGTLAPARGAKVSRGGDVEILERFPLVLVVADDVDGMRNHANRTAYAVKRLCAVAPRRIMVHGTSLQKRLLELHSFLEPVGGDRVFGPPRLFKHRFVRTEKVWFTAHDRYGHNITKTRDKDTGIREGAERELQYLMAPMVIRRTAADVDDVSLPAIQHNLVWLDPSPAQRRAYEELKEGVIRMIDEQGQEVNRITAEAMWMHAWQICSGLATFGNDDSVKLDWVMDMVTGDLSEEKIVVFVNFKPNVAALAARLSAERVGNVVMWGAEASHSVRNQRLARFRADPDCRVLLGTTTIEQSLNLQVARHLIAVDTIRNPQRMGQLLGRVRRVGSAYQTVYLHQLLLRGTQEVYLPAQLAQEQGMADLVWGVAGDLFQTAPLDILRMIAGRDR
jgi:SNF2 family DNA or RNA helicase